jgi:AAHS family 4-hydroxybenzoate transporter-like MFS transporter
MIIGNRVDVIGTIDNAKVSFFQRRLFVMLFIIVTLDGFDTQSIAFVAPAISQAWGLKPGAFGPIFAAGLLGTAFGAVVFGMLADRMGRRIPIICSVALFAIMTGACATTSVYDTLLIYRLIAGAGLGGAMSSSLAMASEYAPQRSKATTVAVCLWGFPLGAVAGG